MMDYLKQYVRMCSANYCAVSYCAGCPFGDRREGTCQAYVLRNIEEAKKIIAEWAEKHPEKTRARDFFEKYPNAPVRGTANYPTACCFDLGYTKGCTYMDCEECWKHPV